MKVDKSVLITFPGDGPIATAGVFLYDEQLLITGHANGLVYLWNLKDKTSRKLYSCSDVIQTIACSTKKELVIGSHAGDLAVATLDGHFTTIKPGARTVQDRIWKCEWINENKFVMTSTYGEFAFFTRDFSGNWNKENVYGHSNSNFGLAASDDRAFLATGDYRGNIFIHDAKGDYRGFERLKVNGNIQGLSWFKNESFAAINSDGRIYLFDRDHEWKQVSDLQNATGFGTSICMTNDGESVFAGTMTEVIQFDRANLQSDSIDIAGSVQVFCHNTHVYVLTRYNFLKFERKPVDVKLDLVKFKYIKIGVVGRTRVGKSTLCSQIVYNSPGDGISTQGKKVWTWNLSETGSLDKRVMFYDYGGQETALSTFLPFLLDSDFILILFSQIDKHSLDEALKVFDTLSKKAADRTKFFLVQTYLDQPVMPEIDFRKIDSLVKDGKIVSNAKISALNGDGIPELKDALQKEISWSASRIMIQNVYSDAVLRTILSLQAKNATALSLDSFMKKFTEDNPSLRVSKTHVRFLLESYSNQGIIEYDPKVLDLIVINDPEYNRLKSEVPIVIMQHDGIAPIDSLRRKFESNKYFEALDAMYLKYRIAIENYEQRIFPELLKEDAIIVAEKFGGYLRGEVSETKFMPPQKISTEGLVDALSELKLRCIDASRNDGLFSWEENAIIYYSFENTGTALDGFHLKASYRIGGKNSQICERLKKVFLSIIEQLYGPFQDIQKTQAEDKKKVESSREVTYDVAISYASEQRSYASELNDDLSSRGVSVFFDKNQDLEAELWGKETAEYLADIYHNKSRYCIMLISKAYVTKAWPTYERQNAIARQIEEMGEYILPVRFDDSVVPGLVPSINYVRGTEKLPRDVADLFMKKLTTK